MTVFGNTKGYQQTIPVTGNIWTGRSLLDSRLRGNDGL